MWPPDQFIGVKADAPGEDGGGLEQDKGQHHLNHRNLKPHAGGVVNQPIRNGNAANVTTSAERADRAII